MDADFSLITMNCITGDTEVFFKNYFGNTRKVPFTYFDPFFEKFGDIVDVEHTGMKVLSDNGEYTPIKKLMRRQFSEDLYRFTLNNGLTIDCTGDHQMLLDDYTVIDAKKVKVGQKLKSPKYPKHVDKIKHINIIDALGDTDDYVIYNSDEIRKSIPGDKKCLFYECLTNATKVKHKRTLYQKKFTIHEYLSIRGKIDIDESKLLISASNGKNKIPAIIPVNKDLGKIAGYIASEGYICKESSSVIFSNQDKKLLNDYVNCVKSVFPDLKCHMLNDINSTSNCKNIITEGKIFVKLLSGIILNKNKSYDISIPDWYSDATIDFIDGFLSAELDGDGYINNTNGQIVISTCCEKFAKQIHKLLLELNISSILKSKNTIGETFTLDGVPSERNHNSYSIFCNGKNSDVFRDTIEYSFKCNNTTFEGISRKATLEWKIASIERIPFNGYVYDFETENHMFVANNILTHNCLYVDLAKVLKDGFNTGHGFIREPKSIRAAASLACVIIQSSQNDCFGGQSLVGFDFALSKYVKMSFKKSFINKFKEFMRFFDYPSDDDFIAELMKEVDFDNILRFNENGSKKYTVIDSDTECSIANYIMHHLKCPEIKYAEIIYDLACEETREETKQAMEALIHNFNSLHSRAGKNGCRRIVVIRF